MKREIYDRSCYNFVTGQMGCLQTVFNIPVLAGESLSIGLAGALRLSPLKRYIVLDAHVHIAFYYVKHRWCYPGTGSDDSWEDIIKNSIADERSSPTTFETINLVTPYDGSPYDVLCVKKTSGAVPAHLIRGYNKIWNRWYRVPNVSDPLDIDTLPAYTSTAGHKYGKPIARLPNWWNTGVPTGRIDNTDFADVAAATEFSLLDLAQVQAEYRDETDRQWFSHRYRDLMSSKWGSKGITTEVDENEAELLYDSSTWLSGIDIDATDTSSLGEYVGKSVGAINVKMPPRYFNEHGTVWCMMALRFPAILKQECHYLYNNTLTADNFLAYPEVVSTTPPIEMTEDDVTANGDADSYGIHPSFNYYRTQPNRVTSDYDGKEGYPFLDDTDIDTTVLFDSITYETPRFGWGTPGADDFFNGTELGHWNLISKAEIESRSPLPAANNSIHAGATHLN